MLKQRFFLLLIIFSSSNAMSGNLLEDTQKPFAVMYDCSDINLKEKNIGTVCKTTKRGHFERTKNGIKEVESGLIMMDEIKTNINQREAIHYCTEIGWRLLTGWFEEYNGKYGFPNEDSEFIALTKKGFEEAFTDEKGESEMEKLWFWSSSIHPDGNDYYGYLFHKGFIAASNRHSRHVLNAALCVSETKLN